MTTSPLGNNMDPLASHRKTMEQARKIMDPAAGYRGYLEVNPLAEYRRIVRDFSALVGMDSSSIASEALGDADEQATPEIATDWLAQNPALIATLLSIAWCCGWLLAQGADVERVGGLLLAALGLAAHFAGKSRGDQD